MPARRRSVAIGSIAAGRLRHIDDECSPSEPFVVDPSHRLTTAHRGLPLPVEREPNGTGLRDISYAKAEDVRSISIERLQRRLGHVDPVTMERLVRVLRLVLEI